MQTNNLNIEQSILSSIIFEQDVSLIKEILEPNDFFYPTHRAIYETILNLDIDGLPIDEEFVRSRAKISEDVMLAILTTNPIANAVAYAKEIKEVARKRELSSLIKSMNTKVDSEDTRSDDILLSVKRAIENFENKQNINDALTLLDINEIPEHNAKFYLESISPIQEKEVNVISAKGGAGKSYTTAYIMLELANKHGLKCFGWFSEDNAGTTKKRLNNLSKLHNLDIKNIVIAGKENRAIQFVVAENKKLEINNLFYNIKKQLKGFDVIVLDPLIAFFGGDENNNADARYFMNLLNEWCEKDNKTIILIHHHSKGENATARGAGAFIDACRIHYVLDYKYQDKKIVDSFVRMLKIDKTNHFNGKKDYEIRLFEKGYDNTIEFVFENQQSSDKKKGKGGLGFEMPNLGFGKDVF